MTIRALSGLLPFLAAAPLHASEADPIPRVPRPPMAELVARWQADQGESWRVAVAQDTGYLELLSGGRAAPRWTPRDDADFRTLARQALAATAPMHGLEDATLEFVSSLHLPLGMIGSTDKMTVRFRQVVKGIPVENGFANVLFDMQGAVLSIHTTGSPLLASFATSPTLDATRAARRAAEWFVGEQGLVPTLIDATLVIDQFDLDGLRTPRLAWKVNTQHVSRAVAPVGKNVFVDASNGVVYRETESVHFFDVSGTVNSFATPGVLPNVVGNPATSQVARFIRVTSGAVTTFTDTNGAFTLSGVNAPASVTFRYANGTWADVNVTSVGGTDYSLVTTLNSATGNVVTMNSPTSALATAQANCSRIVPLLRDFIKATNPSDNHADFSVTANTEVSGSCNAFYNGGSINFYNAAGSCVNSAYSTVISHEEGHWMNDLYGTGNGGDGMGEGNADIWAMYMFDNPIIGQDFNGGSDIRTGTNSSAFCGDANSTCYGGVHANGEPWMGAAWKIRTRLNTTFGNAAGDLIANSIFLAWMSSYNQTEIKSIIETQWLTLDDDDANINNGTPHYTQIDLGFRDQGFPGVTLLPITITSVTDLPDTQNQVGPYVVNATIQANQNPPIITANLRYRVEGGAFNVLPMTNTSGNSWTVSIPAVSAPAHVEYYLSATNNGAATVNFPSSAPNSLVEFDVGIVSVLRFHNFDTSSDEGWTHASVGDTSSSTDDWQRGLPEGKTGTGWSDPGNAFSPNTAWGTDLGAGTANGAYGANVHAYLRAPVTNCTGASSVRLRFRRWLSVQGSASDQARILVNGTQIFINPTTNLNDGAWIQQEVFLGAIANNNPSVQVEWRIKSNGSTNYGGWNIDDVRILWIDTPVPPCATPVNYCSTSPNSVGPGSVMTYQGTPNISTNDFELIATQLPAGSSGIFFYGTSAVQQPFGNGFRCVGGSVFRLPLVTADFIGDAHYAINYGAAPAPITAGSLWRFQYWYRNPAAGGAGFNLSDGLAVTFCP